ncbi:hypothetical protein FB451DRAFT_1556367 [Mycena latifolia]|nr:hypothetical protein FB451DRAFT_1556367 [Mycena latifolia]
MPQRRHRACAPCSGRCSHSDRDRSTVPCTVLMNVVRRIALSLFDRARRPASSLCTTMPLGDPLSAATVALISAASSPLCSAHPPAPPSLLSIVLSSGPVSLGAEVALPDTVDQPGIVIATAPNESDFGKDGLLKGQRARYTLARLDPDAPSATQQTSSQYRCWVITGLPTRTAAHARNAHLPPPKGSGKLHTHLAFVLREPPNFALPAVASEREGSIGARRQVRRALRVADDWGSFLFDDLLLNYLNLPALRMLTVMSLSVPAAPNRTPVRLAGAPSASQE